MVNDLTNNDVIPAHIAIIMDGNGRWAKSKGLERWQGHKQGVDTVRNIVEAAGEIGVRYLTLYTFSSENWNRPKEEIDVLMGLMIDAIVAETESLMEKQVRVKVIGNIDEMPENVLKSLYGLINETANNTGLTLILALSYSSKNEIITAVKHIVKDFGNEEIDDLEQITPELFSEYLMTKDYPDPDMLIRTSGEYRLSNFLLWQLAYTELYFIDKFWPDFEKEDLYLAIRNFQNRERRFGLTGEQIKK